ncbi:MAG: hydroxyacid dehydrogenase [Spirochaetota bacterium]
MKITVFEVEDWEREVFSDLATEHEVTFVREPLTGANADEHADVDVVAVFIYSKLTADTLSRFAHLKHVATRSTGYDHVDLEWCNEHNVVVTNVPTYGDNTVAEHTMGLLLTISHNLTEAIDRTRKGDFSFVGLQGFDLRDKVFGIIGTGSIGQHVIRMASGFSMDVIAFDVKPDQALAEELGFRYVSMEELLSSSDIITLHVPYSPKTHHLISDDEFDQMKDGVVFLNTSRGPLMNVKALVQAIAKKKVRAAGLDVLPEEPMIREEAELLHHAFREQHHMETLLADHILLRLRNVYITPHSAFNTREAVMRILETTIGNIRSIAGGDAVNVVNQVAHDDR